MCDTPNCICKMISKLKAAEEMLTFLCARREFYQKKMDEIDGMMNASPEIRLASKASLSRDIECLRSGIDKAYKLRRKALDEMLF